MDQIYAHVDFYSSVLVFLSILPVFALFIKLLLKILKIIGIVKNIVLLLILFIIDFYMWSLKLAIWTEIQNLILYSYQLKSNSFFICQIYQSWQW